MNPDQEVALSLYGQSVDQNVMDERYRQVLRQFAPLIERSIVRVLRMTSEEAVKSFQPQSLDFVYIDGDHRYEAVKRDLHLWSGTLKVGGLLCGDDYLGGKWWGDGVIRALHEFLAEDRRFQIALVLGNQFALRRVG